MGLLQAISYYTLTYWTLFSGSGMGEGVLGARRAQRARDERVRVSCTIEKPRYVFQQDRFQQLVGDVHKEVSGLIKFYILQNSF